MTISRAKSVTVVGVGRLGLCTALCIERYEIRMTLMIAWLWYSEIRTFNIMRLNKLAILVAGLDIRFWVLMY